MKRIGTVLLILLLVLSSAAAQALGENMMRIINEWKTSPQTAVIQPAVEQPAAVPAAEEPAAVQPDEQSAEEQPAEEQPAEVPADSPELILKEHTFSYTTLTASADKEEIEDSTAVDSEGQLYFKTFGTVTKRWSEGKGVTSIELGKAFSGGIVFTAEGNAELVLTVSSTGKTNESAVAVYDALGNAVANHEAKETVYGTEKTVLTYSLGAGRYYIVSPASETLNRGVRVFSAVVSDFVEPEPAVEEPVEEPAEEVYEWDFRYFGVSVGADRNYVVSAGDGVSESVSLSSATFRDDGSIDKKGGKFVADSPADGGSYYYTVIDPTTTNFYLQADITVDKINPTPDGQEGFALMVRDALGEQGVSGNWMANLFSVAATKLPSREVRTQGNATIGVRAYTGIRTPEASDKNEITAIREGWFLEDDGLTKQVENGETYRVSLEKTDYAYIVRQYDPGTGREIGSYTWYIPAKDSSAGSVSSYAELDDPLTYQEDNRAYVALVTARGMNATFSNIVFTTSSWNAEGWKAQPTKYRDLTTEYISQGYASGGTYTAVFRTNADGTAKVLCNDKVVAQGVAVKADTPCKVTFGMTDEQARVRVLFTPDPEFKFGDFEKLKSYDERPFGIDVIQRNLGRDGIIYVSPNGSSLNNGTSYDDCVDIRTAFNYAAPGQTVLLTGDAYSLRTLKISIGRGHDGTAEKPITVTSSAGQFVTLDFKGTGEGIESYGDYWNFSFINITGTKDGKHGMQLAGSHCTLERVNFFNNGDSGLTVSGSSYDPKEFWPSYNLIKNCTSVNNADSAMEDADGFCAKLTAGEGIVFDGCIAAYNADDGWDLFAKVATGQIGSVTMKNCAAYKNGYLMVKEGSTAKKFTFADVYCDADGTLTFGEGFEMEAGNGNGFKMGGSNLPGAHVLKNSISYENKAKGIDSNSCSDIKVYDSTSYNNGGNNVSMYTGNKGAVTGYAAEGVISFRSGEYNNTADNLALQSQSASDVYSSSDFWWDASKQQSINSEGTAVDPSWFVSLDTSVSPSRKADGKIDMHGLLLLTEEKRFECAAGARGAAWGQSEAAIWVVGDSTVSSFNDKYFIPREGYGEELSNYLKADVYNLAHSGASSKDFTGMSEYRVLMENLGVSEAQDKFLIIGFGHNDEKSETARYTNPNGSYMEKGSFANSLYENYILPALERGVTPVVCTPIARLTKENTLESYNSASGHKTEDVTVGEYTFYGGDYAAAILSMVEDLQKQGMKVEYIDLTSATIELNVEMGDTAQYLHAFTGAKYGEDENTLLVTGLDQTHTNAYGAKMNAYLISKLAEKTAPTLYKYSIGREMPAFGQFFASSANPDYVVVDYKTPTDEQISSVSWPVLTDADGNVWHGTVFGDVGGESAISDANFSAVVDGDQIMLSVRNNKGKIASGSDGLMFYFVKLPAGSTFTLSAKATVVELNANNQVSFGLMVRDDLYINKYISSTMGDYVAAGERNQGKIVNFGRKSSALVGAAPSVTPDLTVGSVIDLKITATKDGYTLTFGDETSSAGFDYPLTSVDPDYIYAGLYAVRGCTVIFSDISLVIDK